MGHRRFMLSSVLQNSATTWRSVCLFIRSIWDLSATVSSLLVIRLGLTLISVTFQSFTAGLLGSLFHWKYIPLTMLFSYDSITWSEKTHHVWTAFLDLAIYKTWIATFVLLSKRKSHGPLQVSHDSRLSTKAAKQRFTKHLYRISVSPLHHLQRSTFG